MNLTELNKCSLEDCGISHLVKKLDCNCDRPPMNKSGAHRMDNHCVEYFRNKIKEFEEAEIDCMTTNNGVKHLK